MKEYYRIRDTRNEVMRMSDAECMSKYNRERAAYLAELNNEYYEWQDHFASMFD